VFGCVVIGSFKFRLDKLCSDCYVELGTDPLWLCWGKLRLVVTVMLSLDQFMLSCVIAVFS